MTELLNWVKNIACFTIVINAFYHLLPNGKYERYIRFFGGLILVILVISPILTWGEDATVIEELLSFEGAKMQESRIDLELEDMEEQRDVYLKHEYERAIQADIRQILQNQGCNVTSISLKLTDAYEIESVEVDLDVQEESTAAVSGRELADWLKPSYTIESEAITIR